MSSYMKYPSSLGRLAKMAYNGHVHYAPNGPIKQKRNRYAPYVPKKQLRIAAPKINPKKGRRSLKPGPKLNRQTGPAVSMNAMHGHTTHLSNAFIKKCRDAITPLQTQYFKYTNQPTSAFGQCNYFQTSILYDPTDVISISGNISLAAGSNTIKYAMLNASLRVQINNARTSQCFLRIYECQARGDVPVDAGVTNTPLQMLNQGWTDAGLTSALTDVSGNVFSSPLFTTWFKVIRTKNLELQPGEEKVLLIEDKSEHVINMERWAPQGTDLLIAKQRVSKFYLIQQWGQTCHDSVTNTLVSVDKTYLDIITTKTYEYKYVQPYVNKVYSTGAFGTVAIAQFVNPDTDVVINVP